jgi:hypothetical protein
LARSAADAALAILGSGAVLDDEPYADWAEPARSEAGALVRRARRSGWEAAASTGDHGRAAELADDAVADDALVHHIVGEARLVAPEQAQHAIRKPARMAHHAIRQDVGFK